MPIPEPLSPLAQAVVYAAQKLGLIPGRTPREVDEARRAESERALAALAQAETRRRSELMDEARRRNGEVG